MGKMKLRNKIFTIVLICLIVLAVVGIGIGYALIGADVLAWFSSRYAMWVYVFVILYVLIWLGLYVYDQIKSL